MAVRSPLLDYIRLRVYAKEAAGICDTLLLPWISCLWMNRFSEKLICRMNISLARLAACTSHTSAWRALSRLTSLVARLGIKNRIFTNPLLDISDFEYFILAFFSLHLYFWRVLGAAAGRLSLFPAHKETPGNNRE